MRGRGASTTFFISHFEFSTGIFIWKEMTLSLNVTPLATRRWWPLIFPAYFKFPALSKSFNDDTLCTYTFPNRGQRTRAKVQGTSCSLYFVWNRSFDCVKYLLGTNMLLMRNSKNYQSFLYTFYFFKPKYFMVIHFSKGLRLQTRFIKGLFLNRHDRWQRDVLTLCVLLYTEPF